MSGALTVNAVEESIVNKFMDRITSRSKAESFIAKQFKWHDLDNSGTVDYRKFLLCVETYAPGVEERTLRKIFERYMTKDGTGERLEYKAFADALVSGVKRDPYAAQEQDYLKAFAEEQKNLNNMENAVFKKYNDLDGSGRGDLDLPSNANGSIGNGSKTGRTDAVLRRSQIGNDEGEGYWLLCSGLVFSYLLNFRSHCH